MFLSNLSQIGTTSPAVIASMPLVDASDLPEQTMTRAEHDSVFAKVAEGMLSADAVRASFECLVRDRESVMVELSKLTVKVLETIARPNYRGVKKANLVEMAFMDMVTAYGFLTITTGCLSIDGFTIEDRIAGIRRQLSRLDQDLLDNYRNRAQAQIESRKQRLEKCIKAVKNPETIEEFALFVKISGEDKLTPELRLKRDELVANKLRDDRAATQAAAALVAGVKVEAGMILKETVHTRNQYPLFVVQLDRRVEKEEFWNLQAAAKRFNGWYSSFARDEALPGFQFKSKDSAEQFIAVGRGESVDTSGADVIQKGASKLVVVSKLRAVAEKLEQSATASLNQERMTNTAKRASQASSAEAKARKDLALALTMVNLAGAIERGDAVHLEGLRDKIQVELLLNILSCAKSEEIRATTTSYREAEGRKDEAFTHATLEYVRFPVYTDQAEDVKSLAAKLESKRGYAQLSKRLLFVARNAATSATGCIELAADLVEELFDKLGSQAGEVLPWYWSSVQERRSRLARMEICTPEQLRMACKEFLQYREKEAPVDRAVALERALIGSKVGIDFFPTPKLLARRMVEMAGVTKGKRGCEPQGGNGNICEEIRAAGVEPDVCEVSTQLRDILAAKGFNLIGWDFLEVTGQQWDFIIANPPFGNNADIAHTRHAYSQLAEGGVLVSIVGEGAFCRSGKVESSFRTWLDELDAEIELLPPGTFNDHSLLATTGASARLIRMYKR